MPRTRIDSHFPRGKRLREYIASSQITGMRSKMLSGQTRKSDGKIASAHRPAETMVLKSLRWQKESGLTRRWYLLLLPSLQETPATSTHPIRPVVDARE